MAYTPKQQKFFDTMWPLAQQAGNRTGVDPRIIFAQSALETGWGSSAPNNNYFGIKGSGGVQTTREFVNGTWVTIKDSFKGYSNMAESVSGYADFILGNKRYKPLRTASGLDAQLSALGASGYATDPKYTTKLKSIIGNLPGSAGRVATALGASPRAVATVTEGVQQAVGTAVDAATVATFLATGNWGAALGAVGGSDLLGGVSDAVSNNPLTQFFEWLKELFSANTAARAAAIIVGIILVGIAIVALTGTDKVIVEAAKSTAKVAALAA